MKDIEHIRRILNSHCDNYRRCFQCIIHKGHPKHKCGRGYSFITSRMSDHEVIMCYNAYLGKNTIRKLLEERNEIQSRR